MNQHVIRSIHHRKILNSHMGYTTEFIVELDNGAIGEGSSSTGETISIYEDKTTPVDAKGIIGTIERDGLFDVPLDQNRFDRYLNSKAGAFGRNNCFALSLSFYNAATNVPVPGRGGKAKLWFPRVAVNVLNGGLHAYTNPVLSDFSEFLLVPRFDSFVDLVEQHNRIQDTVKEELLRKNKTVINGNPVSVFDL